jgi:protein-S-isoprenylcysteine O-methyltransferase Ste14
VLLLAIGWSLAESPLGLIPTALLAVVFDLKARVEERWLEEKLPEYAQYRERTPRRFVPGLY